MAKKKEYPSKTTLNLCVKEKSQFNPARVLPFVAILIIAIAAFAKFGVIDRIQKTNDIESEIFTLKKERDDLKASLSGYDEIASEYNRYSVGWMTSDEKALVRRSDMLDLVEDMLMPDSEVRRISINDNMISVTLTGVDLKKTASFVEKLYARDDVENVAVYNASTKHDDTYQTDVSMIITMKQAEEGGTGK